MQDKTKDDVAFLSDEKVSANPPSTIHVVVDHLCCKICYESYSETGEREPKVLKCGHSVCFQCLSLIYKKKNAILCPFCKYIDNMRPCALPKNYDIVLMLPHYPRLPPNQKSYNVEFEKMKSQWAQEQDIVNQLRLNADESLGLVRQAEVQLENLRKHAETANNDFMRARETLKVTEDTLRLFVDLHPEDSAMVSLAEKLGNGKKMTVLESIRLAKEDRLRRNGSKTSSRTSYLSELSNSFRNASTHSGPPPAPPRRQQMTPTSSSTDSRGGHTSFARSIATTAAALLGNDRLPSPSRSSHHNQHIVHSPREQMLIAIRGGGN